MRRRVRTLLSAVHGIVLIGLEQKLATIRRTPSTPSLVRVHLAGLAAADRDERSLRILP